MNKQIALIIISLLSLTSCTKEELTYNHAYTFDKTKFGYASGSFTVDHRLTKEEEKNWCYEMDNKIINILNNAGHNYTIEDIDTSYVYFVGE